MLFHSQHVLLAGSGPFLNHPGEVTREPPSTTRFLSLSDFLVHALARARNLSFPYTPASVRALCLYLSLTHTHTHARMLPLSPPHPKLPLILGLSLPRETLLFEELQGYLAHKETTPHRTPPLRTLCICLR